LLLDYWLGILDLEADSLANKHDAFVETLEVNLILSLSKLIFVFLRLYL